MKRFLPFLLLVIWPFLLLGQNPTVTAALFSKSEMENLVTVRAKPLEIIQHIVLRVFIFMVNFEYFWVLRVSTVLTLRLSMLKQKSSNCSQSWIAFSPAALRAIELIASMCKLRKIRSTTYFTDFGMCAVNDDPFGSTCFGAEIVPFVDCGWPAAAQFSALRADNRDHLSFRHLERVNSMPVNAASLTAKLGWLPRIPSSKFCVALRTYMHRTFSSLGLWSWLFISTVEVFKTLLRAVDPSALLRLEGRLTVCA